jgi:hypothetical protein
MLVACRLSGLSALEGHYAGLNARTQFAPTQKRGAYTNANDGPAEDLARLQLSTVDATPIALDALEQAWAARAKAGDRESKALLVRIRRQRARLMQTA